MEKHPNPKIALPAGALLIFLLGIGAYFFITAQATTTPAATVATSATPAPAISPAADPYIGWSTLNDTTDGVALRYPSTWEANNSLSLFALSTLQYMAKGGTEAPLSIRVLVYAKPEDLPNQLGDAAGSTSIVNYLQTEVAKGDAGAIAGGYKTVTIGSYSAYQANYTNAFPTTYTQYIIEQNGKIYIIETGAVDASEEAVQQQIVQSVAIK